jgi:DNA-directed RNA polymerase specialized sigma24 family protein
MQPPNRTQHHNAATCRAGRARGDEAELYRRHHHALLRAVARFVNAPPDLVEDACQAAWTIMLRRQPDHATLFAWLRVVAIREAWQQSARTRNERPAGLFHSAHPRDLELGEHPDPPADARDVPDRIADRIKHADRLQDLATIKPHDRQALYLKGLGYRYHEIMQITGATYTAVNRRITEGRRALRNLEHQRENDPTKQGNEPDTPPRP